MQLGRCLASPHNAGRTMPFKKVGKNKYKSPSGRIFTSKQVKLYYATEGFKKKPRKRKKKRKRK